MNVLEAFWECELDTQEGADIVNGKTSRGLFTCDL